MVQYKDNQNSKKISTASTRQTQTSSKSKSESRQVRSAEDLKRILVVYQKEAQYYIDNVSAYALSISKARTIRDDEPHLVEITKEALDKLKETKSIEIELKEFEKEFIINEEGKIEKIENIPLEALTRSLDNLEQGAYGIGIHEVMASSFEKRQAVSACIMQNGLNLNNSSRSILSTSVSQGINDNSLEAAQSISSYQYSFGDGSKTNIVIAVPLWIENQSGEKIFLGFPERENSRSGAQYEETCILDLICQKDGQIPPEFILGCYTESPDHEISFVENERHYSNMRQEEREELFNELAAKMDEKAITFNQFINSGNFPNQKLLGKFDKNAIELSKIHARYQKLQEGQTRKIIIQDEQPKVNNESERHDSNVKTTRRHILTSPEPKDKTNKETEGHISTTKRTHVLTSQGPLEESTTQTVDREKKLHRILLGMYNTSGIKTTDLTQGKQALREGKEEPTKVITEEEK